MRKTKKRVGPIYKVLRRPLRVSGEQPFMHSHRAPTTYRDCDVAWNGGHSQRVSQAMSERTENGSQRPSRNLPYRTLADRWNRQCGTKVRYSNRLCATREAAILEHSERTEINAYHCECCGGWHLGHASRRTGSQMSPHRG